jgi:hypothetical protein
MGAASPPYSAWPPQAERGQPIIPPIFSHKQYLRFVHNQARHFGGLRSDHRHIQVWHKLKATNLDQAYPILASLYAADEGASRVPDGLYVALMAMLEYGDFSTLPRYERTLQQLFFTCFVAPSADKGLIDLQQLFVAGDGSKLPTWANPHSRKLCGCPTQ